MPKTKTPSIILVLICGSILTEALKDTVVALSKRLNPKERGATWQLFPGTGTQGTPVDLLKGLFHGGKGKNNVYAMSDTIAQWLTDRIHALDNEPVIVITVAYSRGNRTADLTAHKMKHHKNCQVVHIGIDDVAGVFANTKMVPLVSRNVYADIRLCAQYTPLPVFLFFLTHTLKYENPNTIRKIISLPLDHAAISNTRITFGGDRKDFVLAAGKMTLLEELLSIALKKLGVDIRPADFDTTLNKWINWGMHPNTVWKKPFLHVTNYARTHEKDAHLFLHLGILLLSLAVTFITPSPYDFIAASVIFLLALKTVHSIFCRLTPVAKMAAPLFPSHVTEKNIRESLLDFLGTFDAVAIHFHVDTMAHGLTPELP